jgi:biotin carboxylase
MIIMIIMKRIMMIGAGWEQTPLIQRAKELGHWVLATHPTQEGEALQYADETRIVDSKDILSLDAIFQERGIEAIITDACDYSLYASGLLCWKHGLPGPGFVAVSYSNNKRKSRIACEAAGVKQPPFYACETFEDVLKGVSAVGGYPVILKPVDNRGNFGVNIVSERGDLEGAFFEAVANAHSRQILVEKFIKGTLLTVEGFAIREYGRHASYALSSKKMLGGGRKGVAMELNYPGDISEDAARRTKEINDRVVKALGYDFGFTHTEYIVDEAENIWLVESANRGGGVFISSLIMPALTGVDFPELLIRMACGESISSFPSGDMPAKTMVTMSFIRFSEGGLIRSVTGLEEMLRLPGVICGRLMVKPGDRIRVISTDANRHGFVIAFANTREDLDALIEKAKQMIHVEFCV